MFMKRSKFSQKAWLFVLMLLPLSALAQSINGTVVDQNNQPIPYANIYEKGASNGTTSGDDGSFSLVIEGGVNSKLMISTMGYSPVELTITDFEDIKVTLQEENVGLDEIVLTGNRSKPRTILTSAVPVDNFSAKELASTGKQDINRMLTFTVPSFNSQNQAISDATAHYDPADLRGMGPSRTLVLINGKRKNQSAQVYLNRTPGKGEVGVDLKAIPTAAIERVEILRDGASAQYGSDAIAGVINMVLKKDYEFSAFTARTGITSEGDGFNFAADYNTTLNVGNGGHLNLTLAYYNQRETNRAGTPGVADLPGDARQNEVTWAENNPDLGMHVGLPNLEKGDLFVTFTHPLGENAEFYSYNGFAARTGQSYAYYRAPYWRRDVADANFIARPEDFYGYQPTFETKINDYFNTIGTKWVMGNEWNSDLSVTYGRNDVNYFVNNSVNRDYLALNGTSPRSFAPGGYALSNVVANFDLSKEFSEVISFSGGLEYKLENFKAFEGDPLSYFGAGSDSFAGIKPEEVVDESRSNIAAYVGLDFDLTEKLLLGVAGRYEDYTDAGDNFSYKVMGRYILGDQRGAIRASFSTGFRAPTLHQRFLTNSQYIIVAGSSEPLLQGTLANNNPAVQALGVPNLTHELSQNISAGVTYKFGQKFSVSADFYQIQVDDRVLFSSQIGYANGSPGNPTSPVEQILDQNGVTAVQFFINAGNTVTKGADFVLNFKNAELGKGLFNASLAANINETTIDAIDTPELMAAEGYDIFNSQEQGLITNSRPKSKYILNLNYDLRKWNFGMVNTRWGEVIVTAGAGGTNQALAPKVTTDLNLTYKFTDQMTLSLMAGNIFDVYQDVTLASTNTAQAGNRFVYSSEVQQMGQLGANFNLAFSYSF